jgi:hypothetical protein
MLPGPRSRHRREALRSVNVPRIFVRTKNSVCAIKRSIALGREVNERGGLILPKNGIHGFPVADITLFKGVSRAVPDGSERSQIACVTQVVQHDDIEPDIGNKIMTDFHPMNPAPRSQEPA